VTLPHRDPLARKLSAVPSPLSLALTLFQGQVEPTGRLSRSSLFGIFRIFVGNIHALVDEGGFQQRRKWTRNSGSTDLCKLSDLGYNICALYLHNMDIYNQVIHITYQAMPNHFILSLETFPTFTFKTTSHRTRIGPIR
jgi:hypothetical protein